MKYNIYTMSKVFFFFSSLFPFHILPYFFQSLGPFPKKVIFKVWESPIPFQCVCMVKTTFIKKDVICFFHFHLLIGEQFYRDYVTCDDISTPMANGICVCVFLCFLDLSKIVGSGNTYINAFSQSVFSISELLICFFLLFYLL